MKKQRGYSAWLVTWEWSGEHAAVEDKVAEILDPRSSPNRVQQIVELLYHKEASMSEKVLGGYRDGISPTRRNLQPLRYSSSCLTSSFVSGISRSSESLIL